MAEETVEVSLDGLKRLQSAAQDFARAEVARIVQAVIEDLRSRPSEDVSSEVGARHLWDEYCWSLQEGPFDDDMVLDNVNLGSLSDGFADILRACVLAEVEKLPKHAQIFLSALAFEEDANSDNEESFGCLWIDGIVNAVIEAVNERACRRNLDLIGPHREDTIGYEIEGTGFVWSVLSDCKEAMNLIGAHADTMIDPTADLSQLADEIVETFMIAAREDAEGAVLVRLLDQFENEFSALIREKDVFPSLQKMRTKLLERWNG